MMPEAGCAVTHDGVNAGTAPAVTAVLHHKPQVVAAEGAAPPKPLIPVHPVGTVKLPDEPPTATTPNTKSVVVAVAFKVSVVDGVVELIVFTKSREMEAMFV